jgi:hypothetical protein
MAKGKTINQASLEEFCHNFESSPASKPLAGIAILNNIIDLYNDSLLGIENSYASYESLFESYSAALEKLRDICESNIEDKNIPSKDKDEWFKIKTDIYIFSQLLDSTNNIAKDNPTADISRLLMRKVILINPKEDSIVQLLEQAARFKDPKTLFPEIEQFKAGRKYEIKANENLKRPSLEEVHELSYRLKELKRSSPSIYKAYQHTFDNLQANLKTCCEYQFELNNNCQEENGYLIHVDSLKLGQDRYLKDLNIILSKDPEIIARKLHEAKGNSSESNIDFTKLILENCTLEQSYKAARIGKELQKLEGKIKSNFKDDLKVFCKKIAGIINSKYRLSDRDILAALSSVENFAAKKTEYVYNNTPPANEKSKLRKALGAFTKRFTTASGDKSRASPNIS